MNLRPSLRASRGRHWLTADSQMVADRTSSSQDRWLQRIVKLEWYRGSRRGAEGSEPYYSLDSATRCIECISSKYRATYSILPKPVLHRAASLQRMQRSPGSSDSRSCDRDI